MDGMMIPRKDRVERRGTWRHTLDFWRAFTPYPRVEDISDLSLLRRRQRQGVARRHGQARRLVVAVLCSHGGHSLPGGPGSSCGCCVVFLEGKGNSRNSQ